MYLIGELFEGREKAVRKCHVIGQPFADIKYRCTTNDYFVKYFSTFSGFMGIQFNSGNDKDPS